MKLQELTTLLDERIEAVLRRVLPSILEGVGIVSGGTTTAPAAVNVTGAEKFNAMGLLEGALRAWPQGAAALEKPGDKFDAFLSSMPNQILYPSEGMTAEARAEYENQRRRVMAYLKGQPYPANFFVPALFNGFHPCRREDGTEIAGVYLKAEAEGDTTTRDEVRRFFREWLKSESAPRIMGDSANESLAGREIG